MYVYKGTPGEFIIRYRGSAPPRTFCLTILFVFVFFFSCFAFVFPPLSESLFHSPCRRRRRRTTAPIIVNIIETRETHSKNFIPLPSSYISLLFFFSFSFSFTFSSARSLIAHVPISICARTSLHDACTHFPFHHYHVITFDEYETPNGF